MEIEEVQREILDYWGNSFSFWNKNYGLMKINVRWEIMKW